MTLIYWAVNMFYANYNISTGRDKDEMIQKQAFK